MMMPEEVAEYVIFLLQICTTSLFVCQGGGCLLLMLYESSIRRRLQYGTFLPQFLATVAKKW